MILLDTNVLSETIRPVPEPGVLEWLLQHGDTMLSAVSVGELLRGAAALPVGRRRDALTEGIDRIVSAHAGLVLPYDERAARVYGGMHGRRRALGHPLGVEDGMIAASAFVRGVPVATRNVRDFEGLGLELVNPWDHQP